jgi:hypothetical protein
MSALLWMASQENPYASTWAGPICRAALGMCEAPLLIAGCAAAGGLICFLESRLRRKN